MYKYFIEGNHMYIVKNISYEYDQFVTTESATEYATKRIHQGNLDEVFGVFELKTIIKAQGIPVDTVQVDTLEEGELTTYLKDLASKKLPMQLKYEGNCVTYDNTIR